MSAARLLHRQRLAEGRQQAQHAEQEAATGYVAGGEVNRYDVDRLTSDLANKEEHLRKARFDANGVPPFEPVRSSATTYDLYGHLRGSGRRRS